MKKRVRLEFIVTEVEFADVIVDGEEGMTKEEVIAKAIEQYENGEGVEEYYGGERLSSELDKGSSLDWEVEEADEVQEKTYFTFGSEHLKELDVDASKVILAVQGNEEEARNIVFKSFIGEKFCTSYTETAGKVLKDQYGLTEFSLSGLAAMRRVS